MSWLVASLVLSVLLTVVLNVALRAFPNAGERAARRLEDLASRRMDDPRAYDSVDEPRVRVYFPWKAMLLGSLVLTVVLNVVLWMT